jgi:class 3 adenylate cyclase
VSKIVVPLSDVPDTFDGWHRHLCRECITDHDGWVLGESADGVLAEFALANGREEFVRACAGRAVRCLPLSRRRLYVCLPYTRGCELCDEGALYVET